METLPDGTKRSRRQIKEPVKFVPQDMPPEPKKIPIRNTRTRGRKRSFIPEEEKHEERVPRERRQRQSVLQKKPKAEDLRTECATCKGTGDNENLVRCDECRLCYHFGCLDPPLKNLLNKQAMDGYVRSVILHLLRKMKMKLKEKYISGAQRGTENSKK